MLRSNSKSLRNHVVSPEQEKERLRYGKDYCRYSLRSSVVTLNELLNKSATSLFQKMHCPSHCLNPLLPSKKINSYSLMNIDNSYVLPQKLNVFKRSFIKRCLLYFVIDILCL